MMCLMVSTPLSLGAQPKISVLFVVIVDCRLKEQASGPSPSKKFQVSCDDGV